MSDKPWEKFYSDDARRFDLANMGPTTIPALLDAVAEAHGSQKALSTALPNGSVASITYLELREAVGHFAAYLRGVLKLKPGDVVAIMAPNCIGFCVASLGVLKAGCVATHINPLYTAPELTHQLRDSNANVLIVADLFAEKIEEIDPENRPDHIVTLSLLEFFSPPKRLLLNFAMKRIKKLIPPVRLPHVTFKQALAAGRGRTFPLAPADPNDAALIQYTSGTNGPPKGVVLSHRAVLANIYQADLMTKAARSEGVETVPIILPLFHTTAYVLIFLALLRSGSHGVLCPNPRPLSNLRPVFEKFDVTWLIGIDMLYAALLKESWFTKHLIRHLRFCASGGAAQRASVAEEFGDFAGLDIYQGYGMTECAGTLTINPIGANRPGSVGIPMPGMEVRLVDDAGADVAPGEPGEIIARGPTLMTEYHNQSETTAGAVMGEWLHSGDIGVQDADGFIEIVDRKSDMILVSGFNVSPSEVETALSRQPGILQAAVVGAPSDRTGETPIAFVVCDAPKLTEAAILEACRSELVGYKIPTAIRFVDALPMTSTGKVSRQQIRKLLPHTPEPA